MSDEIRGMDFSIIWVDEMTEQNREELSEIAIRMYDERLKILCNLP